MANSKGSPVGCVFVAGAFFLINAVTVSLNLIFGGSIYETRTKYSDYNGASEYTLIGDLRLSFGLLVIALVIYGIHLYRKKMQEEK
jgi:hypothetical protein